MSWTATYTGVGSDFDASSLETGNGGEIAQQLLEAGQLAVSNVDRPVVVTAYGHNELDENGNITSGTTASLNISIQNEVEDARPQQPGSAEQFPPSTDADATQSDQLPPSADTPADEPAETTPSDPAAGDAPDAPADPTAPGAPLPGSGAVTDAGDSPQEGVAAPSGDASAPGDSQDAAPDTPTDAAPSADEPSQPSS